MAGSTIDLDEIAMPEILDEHRLGLGDPPDRLSCRG
jgi:hypothetical protein